MGGTVPSSSDAEAGLGFAESVLALALGGAARLLAVFFFLGRWPGWGEETRLGGLMEGLCSDDAAGGVGMGAAGWPLSWALGSA